MAIALTPEARAGALYHLMMSIEAAHSLIPMLFHAVDSSIIPVMRRHETLGTSAVWRNCLYDGHCLD